MLSIEVEKIKKKHLKNVGPIRHNEPPHANSPDVASGTVACRLQRVTEGTAMAPWNGPNEKFDIIELKA